jgi:hypothetical protein
VDDATDAARREAGAGWIALAGLLLTLGCGGAPGETPLRRLSPTQYHHTVGDLLGVPVPWTALPDDLRRGGTASLAEGQVVSPYLVEALEFSAVQLSALSDGSPYVWAPCTPQEVEDPAECGRRVVRTFARRAFRRPFRAGEEERLDALYDRELAASGSVRPAVRACIAAVLQAPQFVYRPEFGAPSGTSTPLDSWEIASRLSYLLWDTMPDPALFATAAQNKLSTAAQVEAEVRRMLADDRARTGLAQFHRDWLDTAQIDGAEPSRPVWFPDSDEDQFVERILLPARAAWALELDLFVAETLLEGDGTYAALLTSPDSWASAVTRPWYDAEGADALRSETPVTVQDRDGLTVDLWPVRLDPERRAGLLTSGAFLAARSHPVHPAPVLRGLWVTETLLCQPVGDPPANALDARPPDTLEAADTNRERVEALTADPACRSCHERLDPAGFAFEHFDPLARWRADDHGTAVNASGSIELSDGETLEFRGARELAIGLASSRAAHDCYATHWVRSALGRELEPADDVAIARIQQVFWDAGGDVEELLVAVARSDAFRYRSSP